MKTQSVFFLCLNRNERVADLLLLKAKSGE
jgi:hypothetical protein